MSAEVLPLKKRESAFTDVPGIPYLKLHRATGRFYVRKTKVGKKPLFKSTGETTKVRARTVADQMISDWLHGRRLHTGRVQLIDEVCDELFEFLEAQFKNGDRRERTHQKDKTTLKVIKLLFGAYSLDEINENFWEQWVTQEGRALNRTLFDVAKYLSKVLTYAHRRGYIGRKPAIRSPDKVKKVGRVLTDSEIGAVLRFADPTLRLQIALGFECGLRTNEIRGLRWDWIKETDQGLAIFLPEYWVKANARSILCSPTVHEMLLERRRLSKSEYVFPSYYMQHRAESQKTHSARWRKAVEKARKAGLFTGKVRFYDLRHTFYNRALLDLGLPIQIVSEYGGTSIRTLQKAYLKGGHESTARVAGAVQLPSGEKTVNSNQAKETTHEK